MTYSLWPSNRVYIYQSAVEVAQAADFADSTASLTNGLVFFLSAKVASFVTLIPPIAYLPFLPSRLVYKLFGDDENTFHKISWIAPVLGITVASLAAYKFYAMSSSPAVKRFICGIHSTAMMFFAYAPPSASGLGLITLKNSFKSLIFDANRFIHLEQEQLSLIEKRAEITASLAFLISSISLTVILKNPIVANTVAYPLASFVKIAAELLENQN